MFGEATRKNEIYKTAARLFAEKGYDNIGMRDLAKAIGVKAGSLYNHFERKEDILLGLYRAYGEERKKRLPDIGVLLALAKTEQPHRILMMIDYHFSPELEDTMWHVMAIAVQRMTFDEESRQFIIDNVLATSRELTVPVLEKLVELGRIEPLNIEALNSNLMANCTSAVTLRHSDLKEKLPEWKEGLEWLYSLAIKPTGK